MAVKHSHCLSLLVTLSCKIEIRSNSGCHFCFLALIHFSVRQRGETPQGSYVAGGLPCSAPQRSLTNASAYLHSQQGGISARCPPFLHPRMWPLDHICGLTVCTVHFTGTHTHTIKSSVMNEADWKNEWISGKCKMCVKAVQGSLFTLLSAFKWSPIILKIAPLWEHFFVRCLTMNKGSF